MTITIKHNKTQNGEWLTVNFYSPFVIRHSHHKYIKFLKLKRNTMPVCDFSKKISYRNENIHVFMKITSKPMCVNLIEIE